MKIRIAYIEEPPFYWTAPDGTVTGADIELADAVLRAIGVTVIEHVPTSFDEFLPGVQGGRWDMNVPIFITPQHSQPRPSATASRHRARMARFGITSTEIDPVLGEALR